MHHLMTATATESIHASKHKPTTPTAPKWPSYKGSSHFVGTSPSGRVTVFVDPTLGSEGLKNAQDLVSDADRVMIANDGFFGTKSGHVNVIVFALDGQTDGTGGADHMGCDFTTGADIEVCAAFGSPARVSGLFEAELSECSMNGNLCGESTGEGLSRWCAASVSNNALGDFSTGPAWVSAGMPDFVNQTDNTDTNPNSTGCAMVFISWLLSQGFSLNAIAPKMVSLGDSGSLADLFASLTGNPASGAFDTFIAAVQALPNGVQDDDPFGGAHMSRLSSLNPAAGEIFASILSGLSAGKSAEQIVASVQAVLSGSSYKMGAVCSTRSHRLQRPK